MTTFALLGLEVPVEPDRETARNWLLEELSKPGYSSGESLLQRLGRWFLGLFEGLDEITVSTGPLLAVVVVAVLAVLAIAWRVAGPVRLRHRAGARSVVVHGDDARTAAQMRDAADAAAGAGDWPTAVVERFRAVVRSLEERAVLDERPGRTAREAAADGGARLAALAGALHDAATLFDGVCYGHLPAGPDDDARLRDLDQEVADARPAAPAPVGAP